MKKKTVTEIILKVLNGGVETTTHLLDVFLSPYLMSYKKARRSLLDQDIEEGHSEEIQKKKQTFYNMLGHLKRQGLITRNKGDKTIWKITQKGKEKYQDIFNIELICKKVPSDNPVIFSYDIPEKIRKERDWVREILQLLDFQMTHKSVWVGNCCIPEKFLEEIESKDLINYIHIFEVGKAGTLKKIR